LHRRKKVTKKPKKIILSFTHKLPAWKFHELAEMISDAQMLKCQISVRSSIAAMNSCQKSTPEKNPHLQEAPDMYLNVRVGVASCFISNENGITPREIPCIVCGRLHLHVAAKFQSSGFNSAHLKSAT